MEDYNKWMGGQLCPKNYSFLLRRNCCPHNKTVFQSRIKEKPPLKPLNPPLTQLPESLSSKLDMRQHLRKNHLNPLRICVRPQMVCECCRQCAPSLINTVRIISNLPRACNRANMKKAIHWYYIKSHFLINIALI
jgi:hypothetical protein